jgi:hypothetical protein
MNAVKAHLHSAIQIGAPTYNEGRYEDCFRIYKNAAEAAMSASGGHAALVSRLQAAVMDASRQKDPSQQAWTMRRAMDDVLVMPAPMQPMKLPMPVSASGISQRAITRIGYGPARDTYQDMNDRARERIRQRPAPSRADWNMPSTTLSVHRPQTSSSSSSSSLPPASGSPTREAMPMPTTTREAMLLPTTTRAAMPLPTTTPPRTATASEQRAGAHHDASEQRACAHHDASEQRVGAHHDASEQRACAGGDDASPTKLLDMRGRAEQGIRSAVPSTCGESYGRLAGHRLDWPMAPSWAPPEPKFAGGDGFGDGCWGPAAARDGVRTSHSEAFQSGGRATNKHFVHSLRGGSLAFHDTSDKFVTSNREPGRELPVAMTWGAETYRRGSSSRVASICR